MTDYSSRVRQLFFDTAHAGDAAGPAVQLERGGLRIRLSAETDGGRLARLAYRVFGCPHLVAAAEAFCDEYEGREASALQAYSVPDTLRLLEIPVEKTGRILLLEDAIHALAAKCAGAGD